MTRPHTIALCRFSTVKLDDTRQNAWMLDVLSNSFAYRVGSGRVAQTREFRLRHQRGLKLVESRTAQNSVLRNCVVDGRKEVTEAMSLGEAQFLDATVFGSKDVLQGRLGNLVDKT
jgi:hypothetical protein